MELFNTSMKKLSLHLSRFNPVLIESDPSRTAPLSGFVFMEPEAVNYDENRLYIVTMTDRLSMEILNRKCNLLIITSYGEYIEQYTENMSNVIILPADTNTFELSNEIQGFFSASDRFHTFGTLLINELESNNRLENYLNLLSDYTDHPAAILDLSFRMIARSSHSSQADPVWYYLLNRRLPEESTEAGGINVPEAFSDKERQLLPKPESGKEEALAGAVEQYLRKDLPDLLPTLTYPVIYAHPGIERRILAPLRVGQTNAYVLEIIEKGKQFTSADLAFTYSVAGFLQYYMASQYHSFQRDNTGSLMEEIITGRETDSFRMFERAKALQFLMEPENYLLMIYADKAIGFQQMLGIMHDLRERTGGSAILLGAEILLIVRRKEGMDNARRVIQEFIRGDSSLKCAVSTSFSTVASLRDAYIQCRAAKDLGAKMNVTGSWFEYEAYRELHFITHRLTQEDIDFFCLPVAKEIVQYDRANKTRYAYTLLLYLKNFKNGATVAGMMHTHRNTMFYRLEKIAQLFDLNYNNPAQMSNLTMSFNMLAPQYPDIFV